MKRFFEVTTDLDKAKRFAERHNISDSHWNILLNKAWFRIDENYKELERSLKFAFGDVSLKTVE